MRLDAVGKVDSADILIIGGGIAGLVAANAALDEAPGVNILVVEKASRALRRPGEQRRGQHQLPGA